MEMAWHQAVRQTSHRNAVLGLAKHLQKRAVIPGPIKELESADGSIQDVKNEAGCSDSRAIWHGVCAIKMLANKPEIERDGEM